MSAALLVAGFVTSMINSWLTARLSADALTIARRLTFRDFVQASWSLQSQEREGHLQEIMSNHVNRVSGATLTLASCLVSGFNFAALMVAAIYLNWIAAISIVLGVGDHVLHPATHEPGGQEALDGPTPRPTWPTSGLVSESVTLAQEVRTFNVGPRLVDRVDRYVDRASELTFRTRLLAQTMPTLYQNISIGLVIVGMAAVYATGSNGVESLGPVVVLLVRALSYSQQLQGSYHSLAEAAPYLEELQERQDAYRASVEPGGDRQIDHIGKLAFDDVSFSYVPDVPVLRSLSFEVQPGEAIGIVGPSGSGKSTLVQLLLRLRHPTEGRLVVDGHRRRRGQHRLLVPPRGLRAPGAPAVPRHRGRQHPLLPRRARPGRHRAGGQAGLPARRRDGVAAGYETDVGERGGAVSGGQRQRIVLARALAEEPDVLILDEPTSALDMKSESLVQDTLEGLKGHSTMFIIAHRLSTLNACDRIMVLSNGQLQGFDTHAELRRSNPFFAEAVELSQLR